MSDILTGVPFTDCSITVGEVTGAAVATPLGVGQGIQKGGWMNSNRYLRFG
jgi:hypothetical protein